MAAYTAALAAGSGVWREQTKLATSRRTTGWLLVAARRNARKCRWSAPLLVKAAKKVESGRSLILSSTLVAEEGKEQDVVGLCQGIVGWAKDRQKSDRSCGVLQFDCNVDRVEKNVYHFWERYDSFLHMTATRSSPEHVKFMNEVRPLLKGPIGLVAYEYKDGNIGQPMVLLGPKGEGGLDDATGQGKQTSRFMTGGDTVDEERDYWGLKEAIAAKKEEKKLRQLAFDSDREQLLTRAQQKDKEKELAEANEKALTPEEQERRRRVAEIVAKYDTEKGGNEAAKQAEESGAGKEAEKNSILVGIKSLFGMRNK